MALVPSVSTNGVAGATPAGDNVPTWPAYRVSRHSHIPTSMLPTAILPRRNHRCRMNLMPNGKGMHPVVVAGCFGREPAVPATTAEELNESGAVSQRSPDRGGRDHENPRSMLRC
jgi:hypothetical protein